MQKKKPIQVHYGPGVVVDQLTGEIPEPPVEVALVWSLPLRSGVRVTTYVWDEPDGTTHTRVDISYPDKLGSGLPQDDEITEDDGDDDDDRVGEVRVDISRALAVLEALAWGLRVSIAGYTWELGSDMELRVVLRDDQGKEYFVTPIGAAGMAGRLQLLNRISDREFTHLMRNLAQIKLYAEELGTESTPG